MPKIKKYTLPISIFFVTTLSLLLPSSAFAFATNEIITYGVPQVSKGVIQASTNFCNSAAFVNIISIVVAVGAIYSIISYGFINKEWSKAIMYFVYVSIVYTMFIGVKVNVTIINRYPPNETYIVNNVPWGLGYLSSVFTNFSDQITQQFDTYFSLPDSFKYSQYGFTHSMNLVQSTLLSSRPTSQYLIKNVQNYFEDCSIDTDYINGVKNWDNFWWANDVLVEIKHDPFMDPFLTFIYEKSGGDWSGSEKTCIDAYNTIVSQFNGDYAANVKQINLDLYGTETPPGASFATQYDEVNSVWGFASQNAATTVRNASVMYAMDAVFDAASVTAGIDPTIGSFSKAAAEAQQRTVQNTQGWLSAKNLPIMRGMFEMILYGAFGVIFIMMLTPFGLKYIGAYFMFMLWLASWGPTLSIINYAATVAASNAFAKAGYNAMTGVSTGTSITGMLGLIDVSADKLAIVQGYIGAVPLITLAIITGLSAYGFVNMAQRTEGAATSAATSAGSSAAMGQISMGNVSMNLQDIEMKMKAGWSRREDASMSLGNRDVALDNSRFRSGDSDVSMNNRTDKRDNQLKEFNNNTHKEGNQLFELDTVTAKDGSLSVDRSSIIDATRRELNDQITSSKVISETTNVKGNKYGSGDAEVEAVSGYEKAMENGYKEVNILDTNGNSVKGIFDDNKKEWVSMRTDRGGHNDITMNKEGLGKYAKELHDNKHFLAEAGVRAIQSRLEPGESVRIEETRDPSNNALATLQVSHGAGVSHTDSVKYDFGTHKWSGTEDIEKGHKGSHKYTDSDGHARTIQFNGGELTTVGKGASAFSTYQGLVTDNGKTYNATASLDSNGNIVSINETKGSEATEKDFTSILKGERIIDEKTNKVLRDFNITQYGSTAGLLSGNHNVAGLVADINTYKNNRGEWDARNKSLTENIVNETKDWYQSHGKSLSSSKTTEGVGWNFGVKAGYDATQSKENTEAFNNLAKQVSLEVTNAAQTAWSKGLTDKDAERFITNKVGDWYRENIAKPSGMIAETEKIAPAGSPPPPVSPTEGGQPPTQITMIQ